MSEELVSSALPVREVAAAARRASRVLGPLSEERRNAALEAMAVALEAAGEELIAANALDLKVAAEMLADGDLSAATIERLKLNDSKLAEMTAQIRAVAALPDPLGRTLDAIELDDQAPKANPGTASAGLHLQKVSVSLGVIASLALKSGNAVILKPGKEVERTAEALVRILRATLAAQGLPADAIALVFGRERVAELLQAHDLVDMVIPRGSNALVSYVQANTRIPVLGHAEGICHIYVDRVFDEELALRVIDDSKTDYPAACNAAETVLLHREIAAEFLPRLLAHLKQRGVTTHVGDEVKDWHTEYGDLGLSIGVVDSLDAAIDHIHAHGSSHTESILTEDAAAAERFLREVDAAGVYHNASTRFADGFRYGLGAEVGVSTSKFHARGPVGLEGLTTYKYILRGGGHIAGDYRGKQARAFTHRRSKTSQIS
jgi:glutamate-5-semialdehyde dehydrogenase